MCYAGETWVAAEEAAMKEAIKEVCYEDELRRLVQKAIDDKARAYGLTVKEACVLNLIVDGLDLEQMGRLLDVTGKTVKTHISHIAKKMGVQRQRSIVSLVLGR